MSRKAIAVTLIVVALTCLVGVIIYLVLASFSIPSPNPIHPISTSNVRSQIRAGIDTPVFVSLIGLSGMVICAIIAAGVAIHQTQRNTKLQKKLQEMQHQHEQDMIRHQKEIEKQYTNLDQEELRKKIDADTARKAMLQAQTLADRIHAFKEALLADPSITSLKILDMSSPLKVTSVYVRLRLHRDTRSNFELDQTLQEAEEQHDPNMILRARQLYLENRFRTAIDPDEAIRIYKHCVVIGDPGAGKTTLLKYLALKSVNSQLMGLPNLPIHIELNAFASSKQNNLIDFAAFKWEEKYGFPHWEARKYMIKNLKTGNALLLLDALDETVIGETVDEAEISYRRVTNAITDLATRYHQSPIVVTARKAGYQQRTALSGFTELEVLDFRPQDIRQFVNNWFACHTDLQRRSIATELNAKLERNFRIQALAANPLLLSLVVIVYEAQLDLPDRRAELYKQCIETLLTKWDASRNIRRRREFKPEHKQQLLDEVAWHFHNQRRRYFPEQELLKVIEDFLPAIGLPSDQSNRVLAEIANENGLIKEQARGWHGFLHLTLQEYFVAQRVADRNQLGLLLSHWDDPWWEEVILLYAGHTPDASLLLKMLIGQDSKKAPQRDIFLTNLVLAGRCLAARPTIRQPSLRETVINHLWDYMLKTRYPLTVEQIADTLVEIGGKGVNMRLLDLLSTHADSPLVQVKIALAMGKMGDRSMASPLVQLLSSRSINPYVRQAIANALGQLGEHSIAPPLLHMLLNKEIHWKIQESIADALGELGELSIETDLLHLLTNSQVSSSVRARIALSLGRLGDRSIAPTLLQVLSHPVGDVEVNCNIAAALGILGEQSVVPKLLQLLVNTQIDPIIHQNIILSLGKIGDRTVVPILLQLLSNTQTDQYVRQSIVRSLGILGDSSVVPQLINLLSFNPKLDQNLQQSIINALATLGGHSIAPELFRMSTNEQYPLNLRMHMVDTLGLLGNRSVVPELLHLYSKMSPILSMHGHIANTLGRFGKRFVVPELLSLLSNPQVSSNLQVLITGTLSQLGDHSIVPNLIQMLSDKQIDANIRIQIANAIGQLAEDEATIRALATLLPTSDIADYIYSILWSTSRRAGVRLSE